MRRTLELGTLDVDLIEEAGRPGFKFDWLQNERRRKERAMSAKWLRQNSIRKDEDFNRHELVKLLLAHGSRTWEASLS